MFTQGVYNSAYTLMLGKKYLRKFCLSETALDVSLLIFLLFLVIILARTQCQAHLGTKSKTQEPLLNGFVSDTILHLHI